MSCDQKVDLQIASLMWLDCRSPSSEVPLFYQPGKAGFYAPRVGNNTPERLNAYCNVGRLIGLSLLFSEVMPLPLCRHVFKYILIRTVSR